MTNKKKIPVISPERLDNSSSFYNTSMTKEEKKAQSFLKGQEPIQQFTVRMPVSLYKELKQLAFNMDTKINHIIVDLIKNHLHK